MAEKIRINQYEKNIDWIELHKRSHKKIGRNLTRTNVRLIIVLPYK